MSYEDILVETAGTVATITVNRPKVRNAIRHETMLEIEKALDAIETDDEVRVVVLTGSGEKAFISGGDISCMASDPLWPQKAVKGQEICARIESFPKPVIAKLNGLALGAGTEIALCCDIRIAVDTIVMGQPEVGLGLTPGYGATQRLPRFVGMGRAKELMLLGEPINAQQALQMGLVNKVVARNELDDAVAAFARRLSSMGPLALHMVKAAVNSAGQTGLREGLAIEIEGYTRCFESEDRMEGVAAFLEKRKPQFKGR